VVARESLIKARGGGTFVLELPQYVRDSSWDQDTTAYLARIRQDGWNVSIVSSMDELVDFAKHFSRASYASSSTTPARTKIHEQ